MAPLLSTDRAITRGRGPRLGLHAPRVAHLRSSRVSRLSAVATEPAASSRSLTWEQVRSAGVADLSSYTLREGQVPAATPTPALPTRPDSHLNSKKAIVLFRDTNAWCPFCERVWLALEEKGLEYDSVPIELYNKPKWYEELVPTSLVPAISLHQGAEVLWESKDILLALEDKFPDAPRLLPTDPERRQQALALLAELDASPLSQAGYSYMTGGKRISRNPDPNAPPPAPLQQLEQEFKEALGWFESDVLARHPDGPYLLGAEYSLLDIMCISYMERVGAGLPKFRGMDIRTNPAYPNTAAWFAAMAARPAYQRVRSDDQTLHLLFGRIMGLTEDNSSSSSVSADEAVQRARKEAADALANNMHSVLEAVVQNSGLVRYACSPWGATTRSINGRPPVLAPAVQRAAFRELARVANCLRDGSLGPRSDRPIGSAIAAVVDNYLRSCWSEVGALSGLSSEAAAQLTATCTLAITSCYADAVEPLPWDPQWLHQPDTPAAAAAKAAAEEAAMKVELNRTAILEDIIRKSGLARSNADAFGATYQSFNGYKPKISPAVVEAVDDCLKRLCLLLLRGQTGPKPEKRESAAVASAAVAFFRNRASAPRDMTAAAAEQFRAACDYLLQDIY